MRQNHSFSPSLLRHVFAFLLHELTSPLSSLVTGLDLLEEGMSHEDLLPTLKNASLTLRGRLEFFRAALGTGGHSLSLLHVKKLLKKFWGHHQKSPVILRTDVEKIEEGVGQRILLLALWLSHTKDFHADPAHLIYEKGRFSASVNGHSYTEHALQEALNQWPESFTPKTSLLPFIGLFLSEDSSARDLS